MFLAKYVIALGGPALILRSPVHPWNTTANRVVHIQRRHTGREISRLILYCLGLGATDRVYRHDVHGTPAKNCWKFLRVKGVPRPLETILPQVTYKQHGCVGGACGHPSTSDWRHFDSQGYGENT
ncbi:hypothetical protein QBC33DRAFT_549598 [Phialemonium atrogriseum]|uniref:Uncharacterized protein n=1 Tax=Phialemonium atrogriseum TaxID=1093897 RepID=A0AAJ0BSD8_9PEZI|nr:uncharacterized protein QBC33DRAFT_549598 [Phialemonium atrogriseum]KAK1763628.1 hypothetical protein QBC33DRAFT_549598 [Phialemonium atrogriseum]